MDDFHVGVVSNTDVQTDYDRGQYFFWKIQQELAFDVLAGRNIYMVCTRQEEKKRKIKIKTCYLEQRRKNHGCSQRSFRRAFAPAKAQACDSSLMKQESWLMARGLSWKTLELRSCQMEWLTKMNKEQTPFLCSAGLAESRLSWKDMTEVASCMAVAKPRQLGQRATMHHSRLEKGHSMKRCSAVSRLRRQRGQK